MRRPQEESASFILYDNFMIHMRYIYGYGTRNGRLMDRRPVRRPGCSKGTSGRACCSYTPVFVISMVVQGSYGRTPSAHPP